MSAPGGRLYEGTVVHRRTRPTEHVLRYRVALPLVDLDRLDEQLGRHLAWGRRPWHPIRYRADDHLPDRPGTLAERARAEMTSALGRPPRGRLLLLAHPRTWGWWFNPLSLVHAVDDDGAVDAVLLEVTNTPWGERTTHVLPGGQEGRWGGEVGKDLSPFLPMDLRWRCSGSLSDERLRARVEVVDPGGERALDAVLTTTGRPLDRAAMSRLLWRRALMPQRTSAGIHVEAFRLWRKRVPIHRHPDSEGAT